MKSSLVGNGAAWPSLLSEWCQFDIAHLSDWLRLFGLNPDELSCVDLQESSDGLRLQLESSKEPVWLDVSRDVMSRLQVSLWWMNDGQSAFLHGRVHSQSGQTQWVLCEPIVLDFLPILVVSDHDWYDQLITKIYNDQLSTYINNFYRLLASPALQFQFLEANYISTVQYSLRNRIEGVASTPRLIDVGRAESDFLKIILPMHQDYNAVNVRQWVKKSRDLIFNSYHD